MSTSKLYTWIRYASDCTSADCLWSKQETDSEKIKCEHLPMQCIVCKSKTQQFFSYHYMEANALMVSNCKVLRFVLLLLLYCHLGWLLVQPIQKGAIGVKYEWV